MGVRPLRDWLVVKLDPIPEKVGSILLLGADAPRLRTGTVLRVGPGRWSKKGRRIPVGVEPGEQVAFFRENLEHQQGKQVTRVVQEMEDDTGLLRVDDILYAGSW